MIYVILSIILFFLLFLITFLDGLLHDYSPCYSECFEIAVRLIVFNFVMVLIFKSPMLLCWYILYYILDCVGIIHELIEKKGEEKQ